MSEIITEITTNPFFGIALTIITYYIGIRLKKRYNKSFVSPFLISLAMIIVILEVFKIPSENYYEGGDVISMFLGPVTAVLAYSIYKQIHLLKKYAIPIVIGSLVGSVVSITGVILLCALFGINDVVTISVIPKSVTVPIAISISTSYGGDASITAVAVMITGLTGSMMGPFMIKMFRVKNRMAAGIAMGTSSHGLGTAKALEIGEVEGAMAGIAMGITGFLTTLVTIIIM